MGLVGLSSCSSRWGVDLERWVNPTPCSLAQSYDVMARATVISAGPTREITFSVWPSSPVWVTPLVVEVERDLRNALPPGRHTVVVSAPLQNSRSLRTFQPTGIGDGRFGWLFAVSLDGHWYMSFDGLITSTEPDRFVSPVLDESYASESDFEVALNEAIRTCPRVDFLRAGLDAGT
jgi:hypothetical protein